MPVNPPNRRAERLEFVRQRFEWNQFFGADVGLKLVAVNDVNQIVEFVSVRHQNGFPTSAFVEFAVA